MKTFSSAITNANSFLSLWVTFLIYLQTRVYWLFSAIRTSQTLVQTRSEPRSRVRSASPASVDKLHGLHGQGSSYNVICIMSAYSYNHQPVQLAHDEDQVVLRKGCGQAS